MCNLLSISKLTRDSNRIAKFSQSCCKFQDMHSETLFGSAREVDGLYYFDEDSLKVDKLKLQVVVKFLFLLRTK